MLGHLILAALAQVEPAAPQALLVFPALVALLVPLALAQALVLIPLMELLAALMPVELLVPVVLLVVVLVALDPLKIITSFTKGMHLS